MLIHATSEFPARNNKRYSYAKFLFRVELLFIFPTGLTFHLFVIKRIRAKLSRVFFNGTKRFTTGKNSRNVGLYTKFPKMVRTTTSKFCSGNLFEDPLLWKRKREKNRAQIIRQISVIAVLHIFRNTRYKHSLWKRNLYAPSILPAKYYSISAIHLIEQLFLIFIYLFASLLSCLMINIAHIAFWRQIDCMYIKLLIYYLSKLL